MAESGVDDYELVPWFATFAPANTPQETIQKLNNSMLRAMQSEKVNDIFSGIGAEKIGSSPEELRTYLAKETDKWRSEEHTSELQSRDKLVYRLLLEKKK